MGIVQPPITKIPRTSLSCLLDASERHVSFVGGSYHEKTNCTHHHHHDPYTKKENIHISSFTSPRAINTFNKASASASAALALSFFKIYGKIPHLEILPVDIRNVVHKELSLETYKTNTKTNAMSLSFIVNQEDENKEQETADEVQTDCSSECTDDMYQAYGSHPVTPVFELTKKRESHSLFVNNTSVCSKKNCYRCVNSFFGPFCQFHKPSRLCKVLECTKCAKTGGYCISHGGGRRCHMDNCLKSAKEGGYCIAHGGGKRCDYDACTKSALVGGYCSAHGGGRRCSFIECNKTALKGGFCIAHGGGRRCEILNCPRSAVGGQFCVSHGGGRRCREKGCTKGAVRYGVCIRHGARRKPIM